MNSNILWYSKHFPLSAISIFLHTVVGCGLGLRVGFWTLRGKVAIVRTRWPAGQIPCLDSGPRLESLDSRGAETYEFRNLALHEAQG